MKPILRTVDNDVIMIDTEEDKYEPRKVLSTDRSHISNLKIVAHNPDVEKHFMRRQVITLR